MDVHRSTGVNRTVLGVVGAHKVDSALISVMDGVHEVLRITEPYKLASRTFKPEGTVVVIDDVRIGGDEVIVMAGPCSRKRERFSDRRAVRRREQRSSARGIQAASHRTASGAGRGRLGHAAERRTAQHEACV